MGEHLLIIDDGFWTAQRFKYNRAATTDPDNDDDATQDADGGYQKGSLWFNTSTVTIWICNDATIGSAVWSRVDIDDHDELSGVSVDDHHSQVHDHSAGGDDGGLVSHDVLSDVSSDDHHAKSHGHDGADGSGTIQTWEDLRPLYNGSTVENTEQSIAESGGVVSLLFAQAGGGDVTFIFGGAEYVLDCTPAASVALTAGTDTDPTLNYVYCTESGGVVTLAASTAGWPSAEDFAPIATVLVNAVASVATDGPYKHHAWTDHVQDSRLVGHLGHINKKLRALEATWVSGCAPNALTISSPDAYLTTDAGVVFQLHEHDMPAIDMDAEGIYVTNEPTTPYLHVHTFDDLTQTASGGAINNRWMNFIVWGVISENAGDCKLFMNLPSSSYSTEAAALDDSDNSANYTIPAAYTGTGFLIGRYVVQGKNSGTWVESSDSPIDLRGLLPAVSPGVGTAITDHASLSGLTTDNHHAQVHAIDGGDHTGTLDHSEIANVGASDHHAKYTDAEVDAIVATHTAIAAAHHAKYLDSEAVSAMGVKGDANDLNHDRYTDGEVDGIVATHTALPNAHHAEAHALASHSAMVLDTHLTADTDGAYDAGEANTRLRKIYSDAFDIGQPSGFGAFGIPLLAESTLSAPASFWTASADALPAAIYLAKARGTPASPAAIQNGDFLGAIVFGGLDSGALPAVSAYLASVAKAAPGAGQVTGNLELWTNPGTGVAKRWEVTEGGVLAPVAAHDIATSGQPAGTVYATALNLGDEDMSDHDVGTFTPDITFATPGDLATTVLNAGGAYERFGDMVFIEGKIALSAFTHSTASGALRVTGLPFSVRNNFNYRTVGSVIAKGWTNTGVRSLSAYLTPNTTYILLRYSGSGINHSNLGHTHFLSGATVEIWFSAAYPI
ncbi:MAG: hypothetical protein DRH30_00515 [Deltaproteobacteria bacterium]|nr:MAG: hypothetical protein DRH30_00515 [Deltaproteobacteria bacterium]